MCSAVPRWRLGWSEQASTPGPTPAVGAMERVSVRHEPRTILLTLSTTLLTSAHPQTSSTDVPLGLLDPGHYEVVYLEPDGDRVPMGAITVP